MSSRTTSTWRALQGVQRRLAGGRRRRDDEAGHALDVCRVGLERDRLVLDDEDPAARPARIRASGSLLATGSRTVKRAPGGPDDLQLPPRRDTDWATRASPRPRRPALPLALVEYAAPERRVDGARRQPGPESATLSTTQPPSTWRDLDPRRRRCPGPRSRRRRRCR